VERDTEEREDPWKQRVTGSPPAPRRPAGSDPLFLRKSKIRKHYVDSKKQKKQKPEKVNS
jgi:hypothetical protein